MEERRWSVRRLACSPCSAKRRSRAPTPYSIAQERHRATQLQQASHQAHDASVRVRLDQDAKKAMQRANMMQQQLDSVGHAADEARARAAMLLREAAGKADFRVAAALRRQAVKEMDDVALRQERARISVSEASTAHHSSMSSLGGPMSSLVAAVGKVDLGQGKLAKVAALAGVTVAGATTSAFAGSSEVEEVEE
eukprot:6108168-Prymnesium_polylepis.1